MGDDGVEGFSVGGLAVIYLCRTDFSLTNTSDEYI